jgi:DNA-binding protein YbaB
MYEQPEYPEISIADRKVLSFFAEDAFPPMEANGDGLVTVKMTSRFELIEVRIAQDTAYPQETAALEQAILKAVNAAIRYVAERNGQRLNEYSADLRKE